MFPNPQDALPLPAHPNLEQYKKLAKNLLKACKLQPSNPNSIDAWAERWVNRLVRLADVKVQHFMSVRVSHWADGVADFVERQTISPTRAPGSNPEPCSLTSAQFVIARSQGFRSWPQLVDQAEADLIRRVLPSKEFARWLRTFM